MRRFPKLFNLWVMMLALFTFMVVCPVLNAQVGPAANVALTNVKKTPITLYGGAISASVTLAASTVIDMSNYTGGTLEVTINSGTGTLYFTPYVHFASTGTFTKLYRENVAGTGQEVYPAISTTASTSLSYTINKIKAKYMKLVPTFAAPPSDLLNATITFTPSLD